MKYSKKKTSRFPIFNSRCASSSESTTSRRRQSIGSSQRRGTLKKEWVKKNLKKIETAYTNFDSRIQDLLRAKTSSTSIKKSSFHQRRQSNDQMRKPFQSASQKPFHQRKPSRIRSMDKRGYNSFQHNPQIGNQIQKKNNFFSNKRSQGQFSAISKENFDTNSYREREVFYCAQLEKMQKKLISLTKAKKKLEKENTKLNSKANKFRLDLDNNKKYLKMMKEEMESFHEENRSLIQERKQFEEMMQRAPRNNAWRDQGVTPFSGYKATPNKSYCDFNGRY